MIYKCVPCVLFKAAACVKRFLIAVAAVGKELYSWLIHESLWNIVGLLILITFRDKKKADGQVFCFYVFWYSLGRLYLEGMRDTDYILYVIPNVLGISQLVAGLMILLSAAGFAYLQVKSKN